MLEKIIIKNVNSIDVCELDFAKGNYRYLEENVKGDIVNPVAIYGRNGSGKSSILNAMAQFIGMMSLPAEALSPFVVKISSLRNTSKSSAKTKVLSKAALSSSLISTAKPMIIFCRHLAIIMFPANTSRSMPIPISRLMMESTILMAASSALRARPLRGLFRF